MRRRNLLALLASGAITRSAGIRAQQRGRVARLGVLSDETALLGAKSLDPFVQGLRNLGYIEGENIAFERQYAEERYETLPSLAAQLVHLHPDVILAVGTGAAQAAKVATRTIPIVFVRVGDPVGTGLVATLATPGGNLTGFSLEFFDIDGKRLQLLTSAVPDAKRMGALWDPRFATAGAELKVYEAAARSLNLELIPAEVQGSDYFEPAIQALVQQNTGALIVVPAITFTEHLQRLLDLMGKARLPAMFYRREFVEAGGLISYGTNLAWMYQRAAAYVDKILKDTKPADLPVEQPSKFELVVNLKTAKALGLTIPREILALADEVIE